MKTSELTDLALDWAVAEAFSLPIKLNPGHGFFIKHPDGWEYFVPSTDWSQGGPIIEREKIHTFFAGGTWIAEHYTSDGCFIGPTPLIAAMRCFVASKLGDEVEIPEELV